MASVSHITGMVLAEIGLLTQLDKQPLSKVVPLLVAALMCDAAVATSLLTPFGAALSRPGRLSSTC